MEIAKKIVGLILVAAIAVFTFIAILSVWDVLADDVKHKSFTTIAILIFAGAITLLVIKMVEYKGWDEKNGLVKK